MITIKLKYSASMEDKTLILLYQNQYAICVRSVYNLLFEENLKELLKNILEYLKKDSICISKIQSLNHVQLMNSWLISSCIREAYLTVKTNPLNKVVFGGRSLFKKISQHKITKEEFRQERHNYPLYSIGTSKPYKGNRFFEIETNGCNITGILFKPNRNTHIHLNVELQNYKNIILKLYLIQESKSSPITYKIDLNYIYISYDEKVLKNINHSFIKNRVMSLDLNPNYIGWTIVDWTGDGQSYKIVDYGIYSSKVLNDKWFALKKKNKKQKGHSSNSEERLHICNLRKHMVIEIAKNIINTAIKYKCEIIAIEDLNIDSCDKCRGKKFNSLCNNLWNKSLFTNNLLKRCNQNNIILQKVKANYSSFIGNLLYRNEILPDMCLASIEIGRRGFEYYNQYIKKTKEQIKGSVMFPIGQAFQRVLTITLEVFGLERCGEDWVSLYKILKKSKVMYRLSINDFQILFSNFLNHESFIKVHDKNMQISYNKII